MQKGLSVRDVEDAFRDATGELLISRSAVFKRSPIPSFEDSQAFVSRDLSGIMVEEMFLDVIFPSTGPKG